jgi:translation elongation factor aEF-1 beta
LIVIMGKISCVYKVMPEDAETDLESIKDQIRDLLDVQDMGEEEVAFGLKAVKVSCITTDEEGGTDAVEEQLEKLENVQSIELEHFDKM